MDIIKYRSSDKRNIDDLGLNVESAKINEDFPVHTHEFNETFIIVSGNATHIVGEWEYPIKEGDVYAIKGDTPHGFKNVHNLSLINIMYDPSFFSKNFPEIRSLPGFVQFFLLEPEARRIGENPSKLILNEQSLKHAIEMAELIIFQQEKLTKTQNLAIKMAFGALVSYLATQYEVNLEIKSNVSLLNHAIAYIEQNLNQNITLSDIAKSVYLSTRQLERMFEKHCGTTPIRYIRDLRLKYALSFLSRTDCSVAECAQNSGFNDVSYFIKIFKQHYGITPYTVKKYINEE